MFFGTCNQADTHWQSSAMLEFGFLRSSSPLPKIQNIAFISFYYLFRMEESVSNSAANSKTISNPSNPSALFYATFAVPNGNKRFQILGKFLHGKYLAFMPKSATWKMEKEIGCLHLPNGRSLANKEVCLCLRYWILQVPVMSKFKVLMNCLRLRKNWKLIRNPITGGVGSLSIFCLNL